MRRLIRHGIVPALSCVILLANGSTGAAGSAVPAEGASSPPELELTLADSVLLALRNNRRLVNARLDRVVQKSALEVAERRYWPTATVGVFRRYGFVRESEDHGSFDRSRTSGLFSGISLRLPTGGELSFTSDNTVLNDGMRQQDESLTLTVRQPLLRDAWLGVERAPVDLARLAEQVNVAVFEDVVTGVITQVVRTYRDFVRTGRRLEISERSLRRAREQLTVNRLLIESGRMAERDLVQTEADITQREFNLAEARNRLDARRLALTDVLDIDTRSQITATEALTVDRVELDHASSLERALAHRPDHRRAQLGIEAAEIGLRLARNERLWDLSLEASARVDDSTGFDSLIDEGDYDVRLNLNVPLGRWQLRQDWLRAKTEVTKTNNELIELRQRIDIEVRNAVRDVEVGYRQVELARRAQELAGQKLEVEREKLKLGLSTNFQLVAFEDDLVNAQNAEVDAIIAYLNALTELDRTLGTTLSTWQIEVEGPGAHGAGN